MRIFCSKAWLLFLVLSSWQSTVRAQDFFDPSQRKDLWETRWEEGLWVQPGQFTLSLTGGRRSLGSSSLFDGGALGRPPSQRKAQTELYAIATLQLPIDALLGRNRSRPAEEAATLREDPNWLLAQQEPQESEVVSGKGEPVALPRSAESEPRSSGLSAEVEQETGLGQRDPESSTSMAPTSAAEAVDFSRETLSPREFLEFIDELVRRVGTAEGAAGDAARLNALVRRARLSGLAPELRLRGVYGFDQTTSLDDVGALYPGETSTRGGRDSLGEVRLTFHLERLLFSSQESTLERQRLLLREAHRKRESEALDLFLSWQTEDAIAREPARFPEEQRKARVKAQAALAHLHVLTQGWFQGWRTLRALKLSRSTRRSLR